MPPHVDVAPDCGVIPRGNVSLMDTFVSPPDGSLLVILIVSVEGPPNGTLLGVNALIGVGAGGVTVKVPLTVVGSLSLVRTVTVLTHAPVVLPITSAVYVQVPPGAIVPPAITMGGGVPTTIPHEGGFTTTVGPKKVIPAGRLSVN